MHFDQTTKSLLSKDAPRGFPWSSWLQAARLPSQLYIFWPLLLGQAMAFQQGAPTDWAVLLLCQAYGLTNQLFIVFANDVADVETDKVNTTFTIFSGGSRVLVRGILPRNHLAIAAVICALLALLSGLVLQVLSGTWQPLLLIIAGLGLLWAYSFPPFRLSYRGGGELLQMLGVGLVLPLIGYSAQSGGMPGFGWAFLVPVLLFSLTCAMSTSLPDEPSDRKSRKRSSAVLLGTRTSQWVILVINAAALCFLLMTPLSGTTFTERALISGLGAVVWLISLGFLDSRPGSRALTIFVALQVSLFLVGLIGLTMVLLTS
jgi:1,4-dihydroxy-2-naphthoate polyprenyltransferase